MGKCKNCDGKGYYMIPSPVDKMFQESTSCRECWGTGDDQAVLEATVVPDYVKVYKEFWEPLVTDCIGSLDRDKVMRELYDYKTMLTEVSKVYEEISGLSKPTTRSDVILQELHNRFIDRDILIEFINDLAYMEDHDGMISLETLKAALG